MGKPGFGWGIRWWWNGGGGGVWGEGRRWHWGGSVLGANGHNSEKGMEGLHLLLDTEYSFVAAVIWAQDDSKLT